MATNSTSRRWPFPSWISNLYSRPQDHRGYYVDYGRAELRPGSSRMRPQSDHPPLTKTKVARGGGNGVLRRYQTRALLSRLRPLTSEAVPCQRGNQKMDGRGFEAWGRPVPADAHWMPGGRGGRWKNENHAGA